MNNPFKKRSVVFDICISDDGLSFTSSIDEALSHAEEKLQQMDETIESLNAIQPQCDKLDYILATCSGALCGIIDIFLVGKPGESPVGNITDKWFADRTKDFARLCDPRVKKDTPLDKAIRCLEEKFTIPYDQRGAGDIASEIFELSPTNHHFKSLAHNPTLLGLFFSVLDQFTNSSHFVSRGELISLNNADSSFELRGGNETAKLFCAFVNWFGHIISDISGSSGSKGRGMGIPAPFISWANDIIALKRALRIPPSEFDKTIGELAVKIFKEGFDIRFQSIQTIPVLINELLVRLMYSVRRLVKYFSELNGAAFSFSKMWKKCEPFSNPTVRRMLTVAHGVFCILDIGEAVAQGFIKGAGSFNPAEFLLRLNIVGIGRLTISLYGEARQAINIFNSKREIVFIKREKIIVDDYINGLKILSAQYNDKFLLTFVHDFENSEMYKEAFEKSVQLAELRNVPEHRILKNKSQIDSYFKRRK